VVHLTVSFPRHTMPWASVVLRSQTSFMRPEAVAMSSAATVAMVLMGCAWVWAKKGSPS
jgi:hypothetical protein